MNYVRNHIVDYFVQLTLRHIFLCVNNAMKMRKEIIINHHNRKNRTDISYEAYVTLSLSVDTVCSSNPYERGPPSLLSNGYQGLFPWG
jgi:hypothetical protein